MFQQYIHVLLCRVAQVGVHEEIRGASFVYPIWWPKLMHKPFNSSDGLALR